VVFNSTLASRTSNSYISVEEADALLVDVPTSDGVEEWLQLVEVDKEKTLVAATFSIDPLSWKGEPCDPEQSLAWPRIINYDGRRTVCEELPYDFRLAVAYTAAFMGNEGGYMSIASGGGATAAEGLNGIEGLTPQDLKGYEAVALGNGAISLKLAKPDAIQSGIQYIPPFAIDMLAKYTKNLTGGLSVTRLRTSSVAKTVVPFIYPNHRLSTGLIREVDGKIFPSVGGWASYPLPGA
jgi:hypothetical protein